MSRGEAVPKLGTRCFPRVSGDEPGAKAVMAVMDQFSPRERG